MYSPEVTGICEINHALKNRDWQYNFQRKVCITAHPNLIAKNGQS